MGEERKKKTLAILKSSGEYMEELVAQVAAGALEDDAIEVVTIDTEQVQEEAILSRLLGGSGEEAVDFILFVTPYVRGDVAKSFWKVACSLYPKQCKGKHAAILGHGPEDAGFIESFRERLDWLGFDLTGANHIVNGVIEAQELKNAYEYGFDLSCTIRRTPNPRRKKLVKCLVCGEIFDASLGICPVCGVGLDRCVPVDEDAAAFRRDTDDTYLIVGGGIAAVSAADAIRRRDHSGKIIMVSAEEELPLNRPMLTKDFALLAENPQSLNIHETDWYEENGITLKLATRAVSMDAANKQVLVEDVKKQTTENLSYDKLIFAAGAECFVPPFAGKELPEVLTIRHLSDSRKLEKLLQTAKTAVVIGGGVLGLEAASELNRQGVAVTVLEASPQIIGRQSDRKNADRMLAIMQRMQVNCYEGVTIEEITQKDGHVNGVRLADGREFPADLVIVSCGNRGNVELVKAAGAEIGRSVKVDCRMRTSLPEVYACGDVCEYDGINYQLWQEASEQGKIAGANAAGDFQQYCTPMLGLSLEGFGTCLYAIGDPGKQEDKKYRKVEVTDEVSRSTEDYWFSGGSLSGAILIGRADKTADISQKVITHARHEEMF
jgi:NADPH-dependent 2,4-dienoyl-CoA reductase/sulfur reductase-like enzyme